MKRCSYCGHENPDDATVCRIDQTPLDTEKAVRTAAKHSRVKPSQAEVLAHLAAPWEVKFAVGLLALGLAFEIISEIIHCWPYHRYLNSHYPDSICDLIVFLVFDFGIYPFLFYAIYRGKNWARWVVSGLLVLASISIPFIFHGSLRWDFYLHAAIELIAVVALFQPASNNWYKAHKKIWDQPVPAAET